MLEAETKTLMLAEKLQNQKSTDDQDGNMDYQFPVGNDENGRNLMDFNPEDAISAMDNMELWINLPDPEDWDACMARPDAALWKAAFLSEAAAFEKLKVMSFLHTREELEADGVTGRPIPIKVVATVKKHPDARYDRHKIRLVMCGHPAYCQRGTHYFETYSYIPETNLIRTVMALAIVRG